MNDVGNTPRAEEHEQHVTWLTECLDKLANDPLTLSYIRNDIKMIEFLQTFETVLADNPLALCRCQTHEVNGHPMLAISQLCPTHSRNGFLMLFTIYESHQTLDLMRGNVYNMPKALQEVMLPEPKDDNG